MDQHASEDGISSNREKSTAFSYTERLNNILNIRLGKHDKALEAFQELSMFLDQNSLNSRRTLRNKVEKRGISIIQDFLKSMRNVKDSLDNIYDSTLQMNQTIDNMIINLQETKDKTFDLRNQINQLQNDRRKVDMQQMILARYLELFQLSNKETETLKQADITMEFFNALEKTQTVHINCQMLLQSGNQTLALCIMEQIASIQETAIEILYRWVQVHCKEIESPKTAFLLAKAMKQFQNRSVLFSNLVDEYSTARRAVVVRLFIDALTKGGPGGVPKPIETYAQDKKRYVGDMLAWLRQFIPIEKEHFLLFLKHCNTKNQEIIDEMNKGLSSVTEGICSLLSVRIEYIISLSLSPFELYDVSNLLLYYRDVMSKELPENVLVKTLSELQEMTECAFLNSIHSLVRHSLLERIEAPAPDLKPSSGVGYLLNFMTEILSIAKLNNERKEFVVKIVNCVIEPLLQAINLSASNLTSVDMAVYLLNCINDILNALSIYEFVDDWIERLQAQAEAQIDTLTSEQASSSVTNLNLGSIYTVLQDSSKVPLSQVPGMDSENLRCFMNKFEEFLNAPHIMILPQLNFVVNIAHREKVLHRANEVIVAVYKELFKCVCDPINAYENPSSLMCHSPEEVEKILISNQKYDPSIEKIIL